MNNISLSDNLLPALHSARWSCWAPSTGLSPVYEKLETGEAKVTRVSAGGNPDSYGKLVCSDIPVESGTAYSFSVDYKPENIKSDNVSISVILTWRRQDGNL